MRNYLVPRIPNVVILITILALPKQRRESYLTVLSKQMGELSGV